MTWPNHRRLAARRRRKSHLRAPGNRGGTANISYPRVDRCQNLPQLQRAQSVRDYLLLREIWVIWDDSTVHLSASTGLKSSVTPWLIWPNLLLVKFDILLLLPSSHSPVRSVWRLTHVLALVQRCIRRLTASTDSKRRSCTALT